MEKNKLHNNQQQNVDNFSNAAASGQTNASSTTSLVPDDLEPVPDKADIKENHLKEDLNDIATDTPATPDEDIRKPEKDITD